MQILLLKKFDFDSIVCFFPDSIS